MRFNDYVTLSDQDYQLMKHNYDKILAEETRDLEDIVKKMQSQKDALQNNNSNKKYDQIINKLDKNIEELSTIISNNSNHFKSLQIPQIKGLFDNPTNNEEIAPSPIRSKWEIEQHNNHNASTDNTPTNEDNRTESPRTPSRSNLVNNLKRNSPMQSNFFASIFKKFNINYKQSTKTNTIINNRFHNIISNNCNEQTIIIDNQEEIIRLLLLYILLKPNCRYINRIASITLDQFSTYSNLTRNN